MIKVWALLLAVLPVHVLAIIIKIAENGTDSSDCYNGKGIVSCGTLKYAFEHGVDNETIFEIGPGVFTLEVSPLFNNMNKISLIGSGQYTSNHLSTRGTQIYCPPGKGLAFENSTSITLSSLTIHNCGAMRPSTSILHEGDKKPTALPTAIYFYQCINVILSNITIQYSNGSGCTMFDVTGDILIEQSLFYSNHNYSSSSFNGGGGLVIEFTYCPPGYSHLNECGKNEIKNVNLMITRSQFNENTATLAQKTNISVFALPHHERHVAIARGGGVSIFFKGKAHNNTITIDGSNLGYLKGIFANQAIWGAGIFVEFQDSSANNIVNIKNCQFVNNHVVGIASNGTGGAGIRVGYLTYTATEPTNNIVLVSGDGLGDTTASCHFLGNNVEGKYGGGISVFSVGSEYNGDTGDRFEVDGCEFGNQVAQYGYAISIVSLPRKNTFKGAMFRNLRSVYECHKYSYLYYTRSTIYLQSVDVEFKENVDLLNNCNFIPKNLILPGLYAVNSGVHFMQNSRTTFSGYLAIQGGAIALYGNSYIELWPNTSIVFENNTALQQGGAVYAKFAPGPAPYSKLCFIRYCDLTKPPNLWENVNITFKHNKAQNGTAIYATNFDNCYWGKAYGMPITSETRKGVFQASPWDAVLHYPTCQNSTSHESCSNEVVSGPSFIQTRTNVNIPNPVQLIPGRRKLLPYYNVTNDKGYSVEAVFSIAVEYSCNISTICNQEIFAVSQSNLYTSQFAVTIRGDPEIFLDENVKRNLKPKIVFQSINNPYLIVYINFTLLCCLPGFVLHPSDSRLKECKCIGNSTSSSLSSKIQCNIDNDNDADTMTATLSEGLYLKYFEEFTSCKHRNFYLGQCPDGFCVNKPINLPTTYNQTELDALICDNNRAGILCGKCKDGYSVAINLVSGVPQCVDCKNSQISHLGWLVWIVSEWIPLAVILLIILAFDIDLVGGHLNAFLVFAQIYSFSVVNSSSNNTLMDFNRAFKVFYGFWNLEFIGSVLPSYCLVGSSNLQTMDTILLQYCVGVIPVLVVLMVIGVSKCNQRVCLCSCYRRLLLRIRYYITCRNKFRIFKEYTHALASFLILAFARLFTYATYSLRKERLTGYDSSGHILKYVDVVYYQGDLEYGHGRHIWYLLISILVLILFVVIPTILLLCYPLMANIEGCLRKVPINLVRRFSDSCFLQRLQPFWLTYYGDLFQSCYKPKLIYRMFAAFLLFFRMALLIAYVVAENRIQANFIQGIMCLVFVFIFVLVQPYNKHYGWLNRTDPAIYASLAGALFFATYGEQFQQSQYMLILPFLFALIPIIFFVGILAWKMINLSRNGNEQRQTCSLRCLSKIMRLKSVGTKRDVELETSSESDLVLSRNITSYQAVSKNSKIMT